MSDGEGGVGSAADIFGGGAGAGGGTSGGDGQSGGGADTAAAGGGVDSMGGGGAAEWLNGFSATADGEGGSNRDYLTAKGFKDPDALVKSYRSLESEFGKLKGSKLSVPGENASAEEVASFREAIGVPKDAKGYEIKAPAGSDGKPIALNEPLIGRLADAAAKAGIPKGAFEATVGEYIQAQLDERADMQARQAALYATWSKAQGPQLAAKEAAMNSARRALGLTDAELMGMRDAWGADRAASLLSRLGEGMAEDVLMGGTGNAFDTSPADAQKELDAQNKNSDPAFLKKLQDPKSPESIRRARLIATVARAKDREEGIAAKTG